MGCGGSKAADEPAGGSAEGGSTSVNEVVVKTDEAAASNGSETPKENRKKSLQTGKRRVGVSAEATKEDAGEYVKTVIEKSAEVIARIGEAMSTNALFAGATALPPHRAPARPGGRAPHPRTAVRQVSTPRRRRT